MSTLQLFSWDLESEDLLPPGWADAIIGLAGSHGHDVTLDGSSVTSRQQSGESRRYSVVAGDVVQRDVAWLDALYRGPLLDLVTQAFGVALFAANDLRSAVNVNRLVGCGTDYESHVDSNPVTGLLFVTRHDDDGALVFQPDGARVTRIRPAPGIFLAFDATRTPHWVEPLRTTNERVSVPMNYYLSPTDQFRPSDLDEYVYGQE